MKHFCQQTAMLWMALLCSLPVQADWYKVEAVMFEYTRPDTDGESWLDDPGLPGYKNSVAPVRPEEPAGETENGTENSEDIARAEPQPGEVTEEEVKEETGPVPYLQLPEEAYRLADIHRSLTLSSAYRPLQHIAWQQPGLDGNEAVYVHFYQTRQTGEDDPLVYDLYGEPVPGICRVDTLLFDAMLRIRSAAFLHVDMDVAYFPPDRGVMLSAGLQEENALIAQALEQGDEQIAEQEDEETGAEQITPYEPASHVRLRETRRIKLNEINYFDHPLFGVLLQVSRMPELEQAPEMTE